MNIISRGTIHDMEISKLQDVIGFSLDADYCSFLERNNGGICVNGSIQITGISQDVSVDNLFGINLPVETSNLLFWVKEYGDEIPPESIVIGSDPGGGLFLLVKGEGVYYWDHAWFFEQSNEDENTYYIASSFTGFLNTIKPLD